MLNLISLSFSAIILFVLIDEFNLEYKSIEIIVFFIMFQSLLFVIVTFISVFKKIKNYKR